MSFDVGPELLLSGGPGGRVEEGLYGAPPSRARSEKQLTSCSAEVEEAFLSQLQSELGLWERASPSTQRSECQDPGRVKASSKPQAFGPAMHSGGSLRGGVALPFGLHVAYSLILDSPTVRGGAPARTPCLHRQRELLSTRTQEPLCQRSWKQRRDYNKAE